MLHKIKYNNITNNFRGGQSYNSEKKERLLKKRFFREIELSFLKSPVFVLSSTAAFIMSW
jgi:hypothetical protein